MPSDKRETIRQAEGFETVRRAYSAAGFCDPCSAQAAWGHQMGFTRVQAVCDACCHNRVPESKRGLIGATRWTNGGFLVGDDTVCGCGSLVSGPDKWGEDWTGECDRAEARSLALYNRLNPIGS